MKSYELLAIIGGCFLCLEIFVPGFVLLPVGISFLLSSIVALSTNSLSIVLLSLFFFNLVVFVLFLFYIKPYLTSKKLQTNASALVGQKVRVVENINCHGQYIGYVKLFGDSWQARPDSCENSMQSGEYVKIISLDGNKVVVEKVN